jgi:hypothetical protein
LMLPKKKENVFIQGSHQKGVCCLPGHIEPGTIIKY